jgi:hypothetical protein
MHYQIKVYGAIDPSWSDWFSEMELASETGSDGRPITTLTGIVVDQASLRGIVTRLWDLNLSLISVVQIEPVSALPRSMNNG